MMLVPWEDRKSFRKDWDGSRGPLIATALVSAFRTRSFAVGFGILVLAPDGTLLSCYALRAPFGIVLHSSLEELWNSQGMNTYRMNLIKNNMMPLCENCPFLTPLSQLHMCL